MYKANRLARPVIPDIDCHEDLMTPVFPTAKNLAAKLAVLLAAAAVVAGSLGPADAETTVAKRRVMHADDMAYGARGPNVSYQSGPRTRVYITKRSWLDAGVEVLPGDRKFNDYAFPPNHSFASQATGRSLDRQPLNSSWDLGGYPEKFPLY
jgi:hypothetical protein